jgi:hypothetical protein
MSVLDLQGLGTTPEKGPPPGSRGSKGCGNVGGTQNNSSLSILCHGLL